MSYSEKIEGQRFSQSYIHIESPICRNFETKFRIGLARSIFQSLHKITTYGAVFCKVKIFANMTITNWAKFLLKTWGNYPGWYFKAKKSIFVHSRYNYGQLPKILFITKRPFFGQKWSFLGVHSCTLCAQIWVFRPWNIILDSCPKVSVRIWLKLLLPCWQKFSPSKKLLRM